jgi:hypothetical protein
VTNGCWRRRSSTVTHGCRGDKGWAAIAWLRRVVAPAAACSRCGEDDAGYC